jgi:hypothetical protein
MIRAGAPRRNTGGYPVDRHVGILARHTQAGQNVPLLQ